MLSQLFVLFGFFSLVLVSVYWINRAVILFDRLIADGQPASVFIEFTALSLPNVIAAGGTWIASPAEMEAGDWAGIEAKVREAAELGKGA